MPDSRDYPSRSEEHLCIVHGDTGKKQAVQRLLKQLVVRITMLPGLRSAALDQLEDFPTSSVPNGATVSSPWERATAGLCETFTSPDKFFPLRIRQNLESSVIPDTIEAATHLRAAL